MAPRWVRLSGGGSLRNGPWMNNEFVFCASLRRDTIKRRSTGWVPIIIGHVNVDTHKKKGRTTPSCWWKRLPGEGSVVERERHGKPLTVDSRATWTTSGQAVTRNLDLIWITGSTATGAAYYVENTNTINESQKHTGRWYCLWVAAGMYLSIKERSEENDVWEWDQKIRTLHTGS